MNKNIVLSNVDNVLLTRLKFEAERQRTDLKTLIISIIRKSLSLDKICNDNLRYNDLDHLAGTWTKKDYNDFLKHQNSLHKSSKN